MMANYIFFGIIILFGLCFIFKPLQTWSLCRKINNLNPFFMLLYNNASDKIRKFLDQPSKAIIVLFGVIIIFLSLLLLLIL